MDIPKAPTYTCATFAEARSPQWKYYTNIGHAKNAVAAQVHWCDVHVYDIVDGELVERWVIPKFTRKAEFPWNTTPEAVAKRKSEEIYGLNRMIDHWTRQVEKARAEVDRLKKERDEIERY